MREAPHERVSVNAANQPAYRVLVLQREEVAATTVDAMQCHPDRYEQVVRRSDGDRVVARDQSCIDE